MWRRRRRLKIDCWLTAKATSTCGLLDLAKERDTIRGR
jgi:hypothetical protein